MPTFTLTRAVPLSPDEAWRRLTEWPRHAGAVPLTRIRVLTPGPTRVGTRFTARSGVAPLTLDDTMEVTVWRPPLGEEGGLCRLEKRGRVILGWAEIEVRPRPGGGSRVRWREELRVRSLPRALDGIVRSTSRMVFARALDRLLKRP
ncbi:Polyketide cyclase / dehydrase and lipid transport [Streptomyces misionensis]|uniref:Polyketide cyclase / dehydrase and lipid transport n=1 Tax=Streptomyces misionensis TaxID=67331 RepID=A0A1H5E5W5_9ACTN|nr:SRPBCC family protein [Streptomyces misionensis]SED86494.1 Polyketide cyclase / dehydrase and lipid transport [Streptomyces misionensis]